MARPSDGVAADGFHVMDTQSAHAMLDTLHHWACTRVNASDGTRGYKVTITHAGRRVSASRRCWIDAVNAAVQKLHKQTPGDRGSGLRLVGGLPHDRAAGE